MGKHEKLYEHILMRRSDAGVSFEALCSLLERLGFISGFEAIIIFSAKQALMKS